VVRELWGTAARVAVFGSQATTLALPGSDVDLVVLGAISEPPPPGGAKHFQNRARQVWMCACVNVCPRIALCLCLLYRT
jgi:hypothetical protein